MDTNKTAVLVAWVACVAAMLFASGMIEMIGKVVFWLMAFVHAVEFFVKSSVMKKAGGSMGQHFVQTMLYGMFHWKPLQDEQAAGH